MLDVLSAGVALGDAGMLYDSSFSCFYQRENPLVFPREIQKYSENVFLYVHVCYVSTSFERFTGSQSWGSFLFEFYGVIERLMRESKRTLQGLL